MNGITTRLRTVAAAGPGPSVARGLAVLAALASVWWVLRVHASVPIDLEVYRFGIDAWRSGGDLYGVLPETSAGIRLPFVYPPFGAVLLGPLAMLPWTAAVVVQAGLSVLALSLTLYLVVRWYDQLGTTAVAVVSVAMVAMLWLEPVLRTGGFGQVNLILMALVAADCLTRSPRWPRGLLVGIAAAVKLTPAGFVLFFLLRRDYRAAAVAAASAAAVTLLTAVVAPRASARFWLGGISGVSPINGSEFHTNQSIRGALERMTLPRPLLMLLLVVFIAVVVVLGGIAIRRCSVPIALLATAGVALLVSPTSWSHHWVWLAPALLVMVLQAVRDRSVGWLLAAAVTVAVIIAAPHQRLPAGGGREFGWTPVAHLVGNAYVLLGFGLLVALVIWQRRAGEPSGSDGADSLSSVRAA